MFAKQTNKQTNKQKKKNQNKTYKYNLSGKLEQLFNGNMW